MQNLQMENASILYIPMQRDNIYYKVISSKLGDMSPLNWFVNIIKVNQVHAKKAIIYCRNVRTVALVFNHFSQMLEEKQFINSKVYFKNRMIAMFHRATDELNKNNVLSAFKEVDSAIRLLIATSSFEMGLDFPDVAFIINFGAPRSLESLSQQSGRGGRALNQAFSLIICQSTSIGKHASSKEMRKYATSTEECMREIVIKHFKINLVEERDIFISRDTESPQGCCCCNICRKNCKCGDCLIPPWLTAVEDN